MHDRNTVILMLRKSQSSIKCGSERMPQIRCRQLWRQEAWPSLSKLSTIWNAWTAVYRVIDQTSPPAPKHITVKVACERPVQRNGTPSSWESSRSEVLSVSASDLWLVWQERQSRSLVRSVLGCRQWSRVWRCLWDARFSLRKNGTSWQTRVGKSSRPR